MKNLLRIVVLSSFIVFVWGVAFAQEQPAQPAGAAQSEPAEQPETATPGKDLTKASEAGVPEGKKEKGGKEEEEEENIGLKQSPMVKTLGAKLGLSPVAAYWVFWCLNFGIVLGVILWAVKAKVLPSMKERTSLIRKSMDEARLASEEAKARLQKIEGRLSRLDDEVAALKSQADKDFTVEEARIKQAAEEDAKRVIEFAEAEIAAAAKAARRDLKAFAADLAVNLAEKKIQVDPQTDRQLVNTFVSDLGKDGK